MSEPRVLLYDLENSPSEGYFWPGQLYDRSIIKVTRDWQILSCAWKWLGESSVHVLGLDDFEDYEPGQAHDYRLCGAIHELFDRADLIIAHNGDGFDQPKAYTKLIRHGYEPPSPAKTVDTLKIARKYFQFDSNKLGALGEALGFGGKTDSGGWDTWEGCIEGDPKAWRKMKKYNKADVVLLEKIYLVLRPWMTNHPNVAALGGKPEACPTCGKGPLILRGTRHLADTWVYDRYQCQGCRHYCRGTKRIPDTAPAYRN